MRQLIQRFLIRVGILATPEEDAYLGWAAMPIHQLTGTLDEVFVSLAQEYLAGRDDREVFGERVVVLGPGGLVMMGPHAPDGWCWCQPRRLPFGVEHKEGAQA